MNNIKMRISIFYVKNGCHSLLRIELPTLLTTMLVDVKICQETPDGDVALYSTLPKGPGVSVLSVGEKNWLPSLQTCKAFPSQ